MGEKVAFIGVGRMGSGMVGRLVAAGHELTLFDPNPAATAPWREKGAKVASSIEAAAREVDVVMASAAVSACDFRLTAVTLSMETQFLEPGRGQLTADGELLHEADGIAFCRAQVTDEAGRSVAHAQGSFRYLPRPTAPEPIPIPFPIPEKQP